MRDWFLICFLFIFLISCGKISEKQSAYNLENGIVKIKIDELYFDVPVRFMYSDTYEKYNSWPSPKSERVNVDFFNMSVLFPEFKPYYPVDKIRWEMGGDVVRFSIMRSNENYKESVMIDMINMYEAMVKSGSYTKINDFNGLVKYDGVSGGSSVLISADRDLVMNCTFSSSKDMVRPSCSVRFVLKNGLEINYVYPAKYFPDWIKINEKIKNIVISFSVKK